RRNRGRRFRDRAWRAAVARRRARWPPPWQPGGPARYRLMASSLSRRWTAADDDQSSSPPIDFGGGVGAGSRRPRSPRPRAQRGGIGGLRPSGDCRPPPLPHAEGGSEAPMDILISGAGIDGLTTAHWLRRYGFIPTIVERAPSLVTGGYKIDVRGTALDVLRRTGVHQAVVASSTHMQGALLVDRAGNVINRMTGD